MAGNALNEFQLDAANAANIPLTEAIQAGRGLVPINTPQPAPIPTTSKPQNSSKTE